MIIRKSQFGQYLQQDQHAFIQFITIHIRTEYPDITEHISDDTMHEMVSNGLARARQYKLQSDEDLTAFIAVMFEISPNFDEHPALQSVLTDERIHVDKRFDALFDPSLNTAWDEAEESYDSSAWFATLGLYVR